MSKKKTDKIYYVMAGFGLAVIILIAGLVLHYNLTKENKIDSINYIEGPHLSGNITVEVDYMEGFEPSQDDLDEVSEIFERYGVSVEFIIDEEIGHIEELSDTQAYVINELYNDELGDTWILFADEHQDSSVLGNTYSSDKIFIYSGKIDDRFGDAYISEATQWVICHEILHAYGAEHDDEIDDGNVMYPYLSIAILDMYDIQFSRETRTELLN